jgi:hypothetical protein
LAALQEEKNSTRRIKKNSAREIKKRYGAPQCCGPGSKGAETQRNEEWPHKEAKVQRKNSLRLGAFARRKKSFLEDPNINP